VPAVFFSKEEVMGNQIQDLEFLEASDQSIQVFGGVYTQVDINAFTDWNFAATSGESLALGNDTLTSIQATTNVTNAPYFTSSYAKADGKAWARTGASSSKSSGTAISSSIYVVYI
jgi:hypothetical protein